MAGRGGAAVAACMAMLALCGAPGAKADWRSCTGWNVRPSPATVQQSALATFCLVNAERERYGVKPLRWNWRLWYAAQRMAGDIVRERFYSHRMPDGRTLLARVAATGYLPNGDDWSLGENLAWGAGALSMPVSVVFAWMTSPQHRVNVLAPDYHDVGIGIALGSPIPGRDDGGVFVAEFGHSTPT
jgi:uncharacterized protein YkwD